MVEFGEKIKQLREEQGMTQQTMAEQLYVTRQAVSRWECGARYPDLLTAKKIGQILNVSVDELLSGEELKVNVEREPVLAQPVENILQTILYTIAAIAYLLMCIFSLYSYVYPNKGLAHTPAGQITFLGISTTCGYAINLIAVSAGLIMSMRNKLTARVTGCIMCLPYVLSAIHFVLTYINMRIKNNGQIDIMGLFTDFVLPLTFAICVLLFFELEEKRLPLAIILLICLLSLAYIALALRSYLPRTTELGFVVRTVHCFGKLGMILLLGYQAYVWDRKRKGAIKL